MRPASAGNSLIDVNDIKTVWLIFVKNWYIVLGFVLIAGLIAYLYSYKLTNVYAARTQLLVKSTDEYNPQSLITDSYYGNTYKTYIDNSNELRVIRSYDLIEKVLERLNMDVSYFIVGRLKTTEVYEGTPFDVKVLNVNPALYEQDITLRILSPEEYELRYERNQAEVVKKFYFNQELLDSDFKLVIRNGGKINSATFRTLKDINYLFRIHNPYTLVSRFQSNLVVENPEYTNILQITVQDVIPKRAAVFLDTLSKVYIENSLKQRLEVNENTLFYIDRQLKEVTDILSSIEDTMQIYKESRNILDLPKEEEMYFSKLAQYDHDKNMLVLQSAALDALEDYIIQNKDPEFLPPNAYININDEFLEKSVSELYSMQIERNSQLVQATPSNMLISGLDKKIDLLKKNLLTYISNSKGAVNSRIKDVENRISKYIGDLKEIPEKNQGLINIQRKQKVNEEMYLFLLQKRSNTYIARASIVPQTKIIEAARSIGVVSPNRGRIFYSFIGVGLVIGLVIVFVRTVFFEKIESLDELKMKTSLPVIGEVIAAKNLSDLVIAVESDPKAPISESFRTIRNNLEYISADTKNKTKAIVITSNRPGEGKTFCSINLSAILGKAGKKVLLLELDLHKPRVQAGLKMTTDTGITSVLIGKKNVEEVIQNTGIENFDVILSGPLPPNPSELILSENLKKIMEYGKENYDYVLIDTPPIGLISDALVLIGLVDTILFVINTKYTYREALNNANEIVNNIGTKNFGLILNGVQRKKSKYYYNRYAYGYGVYGYGGYGGYGQSSKG